MSRRRYTEEFKVAAVREVAERLGISTHSLYVRKRATRRPRSGRADQSRSC
jgi:transposase-like protein